MEKKRRVFKSVLLLSAFLLIFPSVLWAAGQGGEKRVTLNLKSVSVKTFFEEMHKQTRLNFVYNTEQTKTLKPITIQVKDETVHRVLTRVLEGTGFIYNIDGDIITIRKKPEPRKLTEPEVSESVPKTFRVQGIVYDSRREPIPGANIWLKGTKVGTATDVNGHYTLDIPEMEKPVLQFTFLGMNPHEVHYKGQPTLNVTLQDNTTQLKEVEVVATGMFTRKAESFTGAVTTFKADQLKNVGNQNLISSLKNLDPSFVINESIDFGSDPNKLPDMTLRGQSSVPDLKGEYKTAPNQPLFILDGFETTVEKVYDLDMNLVASVTLLKDAAAKAIYGSKAANGVVVIETIQPEKGRLRVSYTGSVDLTAADLSTYNLCNAAEKLQAEVLAGKYSSTNAYTQAQLTEQYNELYKEVVRGVDSYWMSQPLRLGVGHKHSLYLDGGDDAMRYSANLSYNNIAGVMKGSDRTTISGNIVLAYRYKTLSFRNSLSIDSNKAKNSPYGDFSDYSRMNPYWRIHNEDNTLIKQYSTTAYNPLYNAELNSKDESNYTTITENFYGEWEAVKNLRFRARFGMTKRSNGADKFTPASHTKYASILPSSSEYLQRGEYVQANGKSLAISADVGAAYSIDINDHLLYANVSYNVEQSSSESTSVTAVGFPSDKMDYISFGNAYQSGSKPSGSESSDRSIGVVGSVNYSYASRYLLDLSYRLNGSSQFGSKERWGHFWSVGIGWNIHHEPFMRNVRWIDFMKLRASIGYTGSQNFNSYQSISTYTYVTDKTYNGDMGAMLLGLANDNLKWQQQYDRNAGIDLSLFKRLSIRADFYLATTTNLLTDVSLAPSTGFSTYKENMGETQNKGIELGVNYRVWTHTPTRSSLNFFVNLAHNTNKISKISDALKKVNEQQDADKNSNNTSEEAKALMRKPSTRFEEGQSLTAIWAVPSMGIDPVTGKEVFVKKDGTTTYEWNTDDQIVCGDTSPKINGNIGTNFAFHGFDVNLAFTYRLGGQTYNSTLVEKIENVDVDNWNVDKRVLTDRWNTPGVPAKYKSISDKSTTKPTSRFVEDYNEFVFSAINIGYDFSQLKFMQRCLLQYLKLTFNMNDIGWLSTVKKEQGLSYPRARTFSFSLQARF